MCEEVDSDIIKRENAKMKGEKTYMKWLETRSKKNDRLFRKEISERKHE